MLREYFNCDNVRDVTYSSFDEWKLNFDRWVVEEKGECQLNVVVYDKLIMLTYDCEDSLCCSTILKTFENSKCVQSIVDITNE